MILNLKDNKEYIRQKLASLNAPDTTASSLDYNTFQASTGSGDINKAHNMTSCCKRDEKFFGKIKEVVNKLFANNLEAAIYSRLSLNQKSTFFQNLFESIPRRF